MKPTLARLQTLGNVAAFALLLWLTAPLVAIGGRHPFDGTGARVVLLIALALLVVLAIALVQWRARRRNARLFEQLQGADAAATGALEERFRSAMKMLRSGVATPSAAATRRRPWRRRQFYQLPWYLFIGAPGAGKTTALLHSGLRFPLAGQLGTAPVAGIGGTRQCDWWFTDRAVFLDTAGRYTTQDSQASTDTKEWQHFLRLLARYRPVQPLNGVVISVSVPDLLAGGTELTMQADALDRRLRELRSELRLSFPVYLLVTKADLLAGFVEFFGDFNAGDRQQLWGVTFEHDSAKAALPGDLEARLAALAANIARLTPERLQREAALQRRGPIFHFAAQVENLLPAVAGFARRALAGVGESPLQSVRGIYLSSGTQEGNPIDRVIGELARSHGLALKPLPRPDAGGKAYFLSELLHKLVIAEAPLAGTNLQRIAQRRWLAGAAAVGAAALLLLACLGWWLSYRSNLEYVDAVRARVEQVTRQIGPAQAGRIDELLPLYATLENLASNTGVDPARAPFGFGFGLFQGPRLAQSAAQTYHRVLDQTLGPLLAERLSRALKQTSDPAARYDALRVYLMLVTPGRMQRDEVRRWAADAFARAPRDAAAIDHAPGAGEQQEWLRHLDALLERNAVLEAVRIDDASVRAARASLAGVPLAQRVHERLLQRARSAVPADYTLLDLAGPQAGLVLAQQGAASPAAVPALYTRQAWQNHFERPLQQTVALVVDEAAWVFGEAAKKTERAGGGAKAEEIAAQVAKRHAQAAIVQWDRFLASIQAQGDGDNWPRSANTLAAPNSPLRDLLRRLASEFGPPPAAAGSASAVYDATLSAHYRALVDYVRGAATTDRVLDAVGASARDPARAADGVRDLRAEAARAPAPFRDLWNGYAESLAAWRERAPSRPSGPLAELGQACRALIEDRFPFAPLGRRDMPHADFARLFGPQGLLDTYFRNHLAAQVDARARPWRLSNGAQTEGRAETLRSFELADDIRKLFFPVGAQLPQLELRLTPLTMDTELLQFSVDIDGQLLRYENGPRRPKVLSWPGPAATGRVLMRILPAGPSDVGAEVHEGPWALLRVMPRQSWQRKGDLAQVRLSVDGRSLALEVASAAPVSPALLADLSNFQCPETW